jgi:hypothetical protein
MERSDISFVRNNIHLYTDLKDQLNGQGNRPSALCMQQVKIKHKHQVWNPPPNFHKHIGRRIKVSSLKLNIFLNYLQEFGNIVINELLFPIRILYACCAD